MSQEIIDWVEQARKLVHDHIVQNMVQNIDVPHGADVGFSLDIAWTVNTPAVQKVLFRTSINDDERYMVTFEHFGGETETEIKKISDTRMGPVI